MIKNKTLAYAVSAIIALILGVVAYQFLGNKSWIAIGVEFAVVIVSFILAIYILPYTTSEIADVDTRIRQAELVISAQKKIREIEPVRFINDTISNQIEQIRSISKNILDDMTKPGGFNETKMVKLVEYLTDFATYYHFYVNIVSGEITVRNPREEIAKFEADMPESVTAFREFAIRVDEADALTARARANALKTKMALDGLKKSIDTLGDIAKKE